MSSQNDEEQIKRSDSHGRDVNQPFVRVAIEPLDFQVDQSANFDNSDNQNGREQSGKNSGSSGRQCHDGISSWDQKHPILATFIELLNDPLLNFVAGIALGAYTAHHIWFAAFQAIPK